MPKTKLTDLAIKALQPRDKRYSVQDALCPGLEIRVLSTGTKSWNACARVGSRVRRKKLGAYPQMKLRDARTAALTQLRAWEAEADLPPELQPRVAELPTVAEAIEQYCQHRDDARAEEIKKLLVADLVPLVGGMRIDKPTRQHLLRMLERIKDRGQRHPNPSYTGQRMARVVFSATQMLYRWAAHEFGLAINPTLTVDLSVALNKTSTGVARSRILTPDEIKIVWAAEGLSARHRLAVRLLLLTVKRRSEVCEAPRGEFVGDLWTVSAQRAKMGREIVTPLSRQAQELVRESEDRWPWSAYLIPSRNRRTGDESMRGNSLTNAFTRACRRWGIVGACVHDLRRTGASAISATKNVRRSTVLELLGHRPAGAAANYLWSPPVDDMRSALQDWAQELDAITGGL